MTRSLAVVLAVLLFVVTLAAGPALATTSAAGTALATPAGFSQTEFTIRVSEDGTARWTFEYTRPLENESEREQFRAFAEEFERNESRMYRDFVDRSRRLVSAGSNVTGRPMNATEFSRSASVDRLSGARGTVSLAFDWTNFAVVRGDAVRVGDVFEGGLYVGEDQRLVFEAGPSLVITDAQPTSYTQSSQSLRSSDSVTWIGDRQFTDEHPKVTFRPESAVAENSGDSTNTGTTVSTNRSSGDMLLLVGVLVLVVGLVGAAVWQSGALSRVGTVPDDGTADAGTVADPSSAGDDPSGVPDEELLADDDRVVKLLEENGGRMKQVNIVEETEWSKSKVSMLLSEMEDDGEISKLRVGRENIISLTGHEPDAAGSPFDEEE